MIVELNVLILYFPTIFASSYLFDSSLFNSCCFMFYQTFESLIFSVQITALVVVNRVARNA